MKLAIMQPYFLPYIGYFQLMNAADVFVIYDNIKYTKKGWINRNRFLVNGRDHLFSLPLRKGPDSLTVVERQLAETFERAKFLNQFKEAYARAPHFKQAFPVLEKIVTFGDDNLFKFILHSAQQVMTYLNIETRIVKSSDLSIDHQLKGQDKVLAICENLKADTYLNPIGGVELYSVDEFRARNITLKFLKPTLVEYPQFGQAFVPWLSIIDVMMFNSPSEIVMRLSSEFEFV